MLKNAEIVFENNIIGLEFEKGKISDITIWDEDNEIIFNGTADQSRYVLRALDHAFGYNQDSTTGLEDDRQEVE